MTRRQTEIPEHLREALAEAGAMDDVQVLVDPSDDLLEAYALEGRVGVIALVTGGPERRAAAEASARVEMAVTRFRSRLHLEQARDALDELAEVRELDLRLAAQLQKSLLPGRLPSPAGWTLAAAHLPREFVSGDAYDARLVGGSHLLLTTIDAVGHSVPAALLTVLLRTALEPLDHDGRPRPPGAVLEALDRRLCERRIDGSPTAALCHAVVDVPARRLRLASAGHPLPLRIRKGRAPEQLGDSGLLLGIEPCERPGYEVALEPGDRVFFFTDGIGTDLGARFGEQLVAHKDLPLMDQLGGALGAVVGLDAEGRPEDDVTVLAMEVGY